MTSSPLACATCPVRDRAACAALDEGERADLARLGRHRILAPGETLFPAGEPNDRCATLVRGALKISTSDAEGHERILSLIHPAGFVGELFAPLARFDVVALTQSEVCLFTRQDYEAAVERYPELARALLRRSSEDLFGARSLMAMVGRHSARERVAAFLLAMADAASDSPCHPAARFDLPLSRAEVAGLLGLTIETVSRQLSALERSGAIRRHGLRGIELVDAAQLGIGGLP
ncbi:Crp/Fnr family transcriptional regulator [Sphingomonas glaciei]|uniref:Crp/Fnr family transcriptional regulator n=1 Tax=Sphingomonas glaciei TaxID=2938948 RepID=A0ABY5MVB5_9SPHN|nr:Crp/Fnr family transcriptional regulator [Sphingomonas glaciei]UUR07262.1 Crp/Fnr family transcriptional regulator [Sphingomonas glaciei]